MGELEFFDTEQRFHYPALAHLPETCMVLGFIFLAVSSLSPTFIKLSLIFFALYFLLLGLYIGFNTSLTTYKVAKHRKNNILLSDKHTVVWSTVLMLIGVIIFIMTNII